MIFLVLLNLQSAIFSSLMSGFSCRYETIQDRKAVLSDGGRPDMTTRFSAWETASESCVANRRSHLAATPDPFEFLPFCSYNLRGNLTNTIGR